jgi:hypothetical protein
MDDGHLRATSHHKIVGGTRRLEEKEKIKSPSFARTAIGTRPSI